MPQVREGNRRASEQDMSTPHFIGYLLIAFLAGSNAGLAYSNWNIKRHFREWNQSGKSPR
jgi:hypothetical protein